MIRLFLMCSPALCLAWAGMLPTPEIIGAVADAIRKHKVEHVVVDPVLVSTSGASLASSAAANAIVKELLPLATVVTPNLAEVSALLGTVQHKCA